MFVCYQLLATFLVLTCMNIADYDTVLDALVDPELIAAGDYSLTYLGTFPSHMELGMKSTKTVVSMVKEVRRALLSWYDSIDLDILPRDFPAQIQSVKEQNTIQSLPRQPIALQRRQKGSSHSAADALSRAPVRHPEGDGGVSDMDVEEADPLHMAVVSALHSVTEKGLRLAPLKDQKG